jgi:hypothetical protein
MFTRESSWHETVHYRESESTHLLSHHTDAGCGKSVVQLDWNQSATQIAFPSPSRAADAASPAVGYGAHLAWPHPHAPVMTTAQQNRSR